MSVKPNLKVGQLYYSPRTSFLVHSSFENIIEIHKKIKAGKFLGPSPAVEAVRQHQDLLKSLSKNWSSLFPYQAQYTQPGKIFMVVEHRQIEDSISFHLLFNELSGWIFYDKWLKRRIRKVKP